MRIQLSALITVLAAGAATSLVATAPGSAASPTITAWTGTVTHVADGDTIDVDVDGDGTSTPIRVRFSAINAPELTNYSSDPAKWTGECKGVEAAKRTLGLITAAGKRVRLTAQDPNSMSGSRYHRWVAVPDGAGGWRDVGAVLVSEGLAAAMPLKGEWAHNLTYLTAGQKAAQAGLGNFDTDACGFGPNQDAKLQLVVNYDADGTDDANINGEWIRIRNRGTTAVPLGGWYVKEASPTRFHFPAGASVAAGSYVTVYMGSGTNTATQFYWGLPNTIFQNADPAISGGDGAFLHDPHGDARAWMQYPCVVSCVDPLRGKVSLHAQYSGTEYVDLKNTSTGTIYLVNHVLDNPPYVYPFKPGTKLYAGETMRIYVMGSPSGDTRLVKYWGKTSNILNNDGDKVLLRTYDTQRTVCTAWGVVAC